MLNIIILEGRTRIMKKKIIEHIRHLFWAPSVPLFDPWNAIKAIVRGKSHVKTGKPCQDFSHYSVSGDRVIGIICDGAGSAKRSDIGSKWLTELMEYQLDRIPADECGEMLERSMIIAVNQARERYLQRMFESYHNPSDYATTLIAIIILRDAFAVAHIGDGAAAARIDGKLKLISKPENGEYANQTFFITGRNWYRHLRILVGHSIGLEAVALMSDGVTPALVDLKIEQPAPAIDDLFLAVSKGQGSDKDLESILESDMFSTRSFDDKSMVLISRLASFKKHGEGNTKIEEYIEPGDGVDTKEICTTPDTDKI